MDMNERIKRINELYHKSQSVGLTEDEKAEQGRLRREYIDSVKGSLKAQLNNIDIQERDGSITNLGKKFSNNQAAVNSVGNIRTKKALLRKEILQKRSEISDKDHSNWSSKICNTVLASKKYQEADAIFLYYDYNGEVSTKAIFKRAIEDGKKVAYPKCTMVDGEPGLEFYYIDDVNSLTPGYHDIMEPDVFNKELKKVTEFNGLCIVPGVVFDSNRNRIGYGKGFYDRFLKSFSGSIYSMGLCFDIQMTDTIETDEFDITLNEVITETKVF